jgi:hypothetical protein
MEAGGEICFMLKSIIIIERELDLIRCALSLKVDFDLIDIFNQLRTDPKQIGLAKDSFLAFFMYRCTHSGRITSSTREETWSNC